MHVPWHKAKVPDPVLLEEFEVINQGALQYDFRDVRLFEEGLLGCPVVPSLQSL